MPNERLHLGALCVAGLRPCGDTFGDTQQIGPPESPPRDESGRRKALRYRRPKFESRVLQDGQVQQATAKQNVTVRLSDCSGEFADPPSVGLPSRLTEAQIEKAREIAMHCQLSEFKGSN